MSHMAVQDRLYSTYSNDTGPTPNSTQRLGNTLAASQPLSPSWQTRTVGPPPLGLPFADSRASQTVCLPAAVFGSGLTLVQTAVPGCSCCCCPPPPTCPEQTVQLSFLGKLCILLSHTCLSTGQACMQGGDLGLDTQDQQQMSRFVYASVRRIAVRPLSWPCLTSCSCRPHWCRIWTVTPSLHASLCVMPGGWQGVEPCYVLNTGAHAALEW